VTLSPHPEFLRDVTDEQRDAITAPSGPLLVLAGAGSGKTRVITRRVAWLLAGGTPADGVAAITFTNKAAGEMRTRIRELVGTEPPYVCTFHGLGARLLREYGPRIGIDRRFSILDQTDRGLIVKGILKDLDLDASRFRPAAVVQWISRRKNEGQDPDTASEIDSFLDETLLSVWKRYEAALRDGRQLDFDDLLIRTLELLERDEEIRRRLGERFEHVLIDEYQDTNRIQYRLARLLAEPQQNLCATGDPDQSIYRWRGADLRNILDFERDYPGAKVVKLERNYRSTKRILEAASSVIRNNRLRKEKELWTENPQGNPLRLVTTIDEDEEALEIVRRILDLRERGRRLTDVAIFYRTNALSRVLERGFRAYGIPYQIVGAVQFFERREVKDLLAYLRLLQNPWDAVSLERAGGAPSRGVGPRSWKAIRQRAASEGVSPLDVVLDPALRPKLASKPRKGLESFAGIVRALQAMPASPVAPILDEVLRLTDFHDHLLDLGSPQDSDRAENVEELVQSARDYDDRHPDGSLDGYLEEVALVADVDRWEDEADRVTLMTLHTAKGLEFPVVFIVGMEEGILPHQRSQEGPEDLEEERRLFFVGITRAQEELFLAHTPYRGRYAQIGSLLPSRFLQEIPRELFASGDGAASAWDAGASRVREAAERALLEAVEDDVPAPRLSPTDTKLRAGDLVRHATFGVGRVLAVSGRGASLRATVRFDGERSERELMLEYARLERHEPGAAPGGDP